MKNILNSISVKKLAAGSAAAILLSLAMSAPANARVIYGSAPIVYAPAPVYVSRPVYYTPAPVYYAPAPVYYTPAPVYRNYYPFGLNISFFDDRYHGRHHRHRHW